MLTSHASFEFKEKLMKKVRDFNSLRIQCLIVEPTHLHYYVASSCPKGIIPNQPQNFRTKSDLMSELGNKKIQKSDLNRLIDYFREQYLNLEFRISDVRFGLYNTNLISIISTTHGFFVKLKILKIVNIKIFKSRILNFSL